MNPGLVAAGVGAGVSGLAVATAGGSPRTAQEVRVMADEELAIPGVSYGARLVARLNPASGNVYEAIERLGLVDVRTEPLATITSVLADGLVEARFRVAVERQATILETRRSVGLGAFNAGCMPTLSEILEVRTGGEVDRVQTVGERVNEAVREAGRDALRATEGIRSTINLYLLVGLVAGVAAIVYLTRRA